MNPESVRRYVRGCSRGDLLYFVTDNCNVGRPEVRLGFYEGFDSINTNQINYRVPYNSRLSTVPVEWVCEVRRLRTAWQIDEDLRKNRERIAKEKARGKK